MPIAENRIPWLMLRLVPEMTRVRFYTLIDHFQNPGLVLGASAKEIASLRGFDNDLARKVLEAPRGNGIDQEIALMAEHGCRMLTLEDDEYPDNLRQSSFPPPILFIRGDLRPDDRYSIAMVGSRHATQYGKAVAQQFASRMATVGVTVVSGFARGIDSHCHHAALASGGRTVGVLGNGLAVCYPSENRALGEKIAVQGALISEYPMETKPDRYNFPERNHLIAALSLGTIVVEAAEKSGALITANEALDENRFVFAVPGDINRQNSRGTNALIQSGARLVQRAEDVLFEMKDLLKGYLREDQIQPPETAPRGNQNGKSGETKASSAPAVRAPLSPEEEIIVTLLRHEPTYFDALLARLDDQLSVQKLSTVLLGLEMKQVIKQLPGRMYAVFD